MSSFEWTDLTLLKPAFEEALCPTEIGLTADGYLSPCFTNTYIFSPVAIALTLWAVLEVKDLNTEGHRTNTLSSRINFLLTCAYTMVLFLHGPIVFNVISMPVAMITNLIMFVIAFLDFKGVNTNNKPLEVYYFLAAAVSGYLLVQAIGLHQWSEDLLSGTWICLTASIAGSARNIISAFDHAEREAAKKSLKKD